MPALCVQNAQVREFVASSGADLPAWCGEATSVSGNASRGICSVYSLPEKRLITLDMSGEEDDDEGDEDRQES